MKLAIFYHCRISGGHNVDSGASIDPVWGRNLLSMQMAAICNSGLYENANKMVIGLNWDEFDTEMALTEIPEGATLIVHGAKAESLLPTMVFMQKWARQHPDFYILFFHSKGATHPNDPFTTAWRNCMTRHLITDWRKCVADLDAGYDAVGCHWLHNSPNDPNSNRWGSNSFFAGVFFWTTAKYLNTLPPLPEKVTDRHSWFLPELLLGCGKPKIKDYHPELPHVAGCTRSAMR